MSSGRTRINMKANESLRALIDAALDTIKEIIAGIVSVLLTGKNYLKTIFLELILAGCYDFPRKIGLAFAITLSARIRATMTSIESNYANITRGTIGISRNAIRRFGALQRLLDRLGLNGISIPVCIINRCTFGAHRAIHNCE